MNDDDETPDDEWYVYCETCGFDWTIEDPCPFH